MGVGHCLVMGESFLVYGLGQCLGDDLDSHLQGVDGYIVLQCVYHYPVKGEGTARPWVWGHCLVMGGSFSCIWVGAVSL